MKKLFLAILALVVIGAAGFVWSFFGTHKSLTTSDIGRKFSLSAKAPCGILWGTGSAYALLHGQINGTARIQIIGNNERDQTDFIIGPGRVEIAQGGPEEWIGDYSIHYIPLTATSGTISASVYCGHGMSDSDRTLYYETLRNRK